MSTSNLHMHTNTYMWVSQTHFNTTHMLQKEKKSINTAVNLATVLCIVTQ